MTEGSIIDADWFERVRHRGGPVFLLSEAALLYFPAETVRPTLEHVAQAFPGNAPAIDTGGNSQDRNPVLRAVLPAG